MNETYYQPDFNGADNLKDIHGNICWSFYVWRSKETCQKLFPDRKILTYNKDDIEDPTYMD